MLVIIGVVVFTNVLSFRNIESVLINQLKENQLTQTEFAASQIEDYVLQVKNELITLSKFPDIDSFNMNECNGDMSIVHGDIEGKINNLLRVEKDGTVIECSSPIYSNFVGLNIQNKDYFRIPKETNEPFIDSSIRQGNMRQIIIAAPLFETTEYTPYPNFLGRFEGLLLSIIEVNTLYNMYIHPIADPEKSSFLLISLETGETILKSNNMAEYSEIKNDIPIKSRQLSAISNFNGFGETIFTSSDMILGSETWRLIVLTPLENIEENVGSVQKRHFFILGFVIVVIIALFFFMITLYKSKEKVQLKLDRANVTLEQLGINIETETDKYNQADITLEPKKIYLIKEDDENHAHELFIDSLNKGFAGLGIVRENPRELRKKYNLQKTSFIWMTDTKTVDIPTEMKIDNLYRLISEFVKKSKKCVILIDRLDYILSENSFEDVIKRIHSLKDLALSNNCIIIISVNPELVPDVQLKAVETETIDLYGKHLSDKVNLSEMEFEMLKLVNEYNTTNKLISYKDITSKFNITKPTTRAKINNLQNLSLIQVEQRGRFKSLKITSTGRRIIG